MNRCRSISGFLVLMTGLVASAIPGLHSSAVAGDFTLDYRYAPSRWYTPIGLVDDWQKTLVNRNGELHYDFGPGPYIQPNTTVKVGLAGQQLSGAHQYLEDARIPIVETLAGNSSVQMHLREFALVGDEITGHRNGQGTPEPQTRVHRLRGLTGSVGWAEPPRGTDPGFRNVAWGTNRPIIYRLDVKPGSAKKVALGFCESYRIRTGLRVEEMWVEGDSIRTVDLAAAVARNQPQVYLFHARDVNGDGQLSVEVHAAPISRGPNTILNTIWMFPEERELSKQALISGTLTSEAELYVDCGLEPRVLQLPPRRDAVSARFAGEHPRPVITVESHRGLSYDQSTGVLSIDGRPFIVSRPAPVNARRTGNGWKLFLPGDTYEMRMLVIRGYDLPENITQLPDLERELVRAKEYWLHESGIPWKTIHIGGRDLQQLMYSAIRTIYQSREIVDGYPQFQPGMTIYRGLWVHDATYLIDTAAMLGDLNGARRAIEGLLRLQEPSGKLQVMEPIPMYRETALMVWLMCRFARMSGDTAWLQSHWDALAKGVAYLQSLRQRTLSSPEAPYYGLVPPGFTDGGLAGQHAEYSTVYWMLISVEEAVQTAERLGKMSAASEWKAFYRALLGSFKKSAVRDIRHDQAGNPYLPIQVADTTEVKYPQRAQWSLLEAIQYGHFLAPDDSLVRGTLAMLDARNSEGLVPSAGWMDGGIWAYFGGFYGLAHLRVGDVKKARQILYAFANHASPTGIWVEEQMPAGEGRRTAGDSPHAWASAMLVRFVRYMMVSEKAGGIRLLHGAPGEWFVGGTDNRLQHAPTLDGPVSVDAGTYPGHGGGYISVQTDGTLPGVSLWLQALKEHGYLGIDARPLPQELTVRPPFMLLFRRGDGELNNR